MDKSLKEVKGGLDPERQARIDTYAERLKDEHLAFVELRKAYGLTKKQLAETMEVNLDAIDSYERHADILLSTLEKCVADKGGELHLIAKFPGRGLVKIERLGDFYESTPCL